VEVCRVDLQLDMCVAGLCRVAATFTCGSAGRNVQSWHTELLGSGKSHTLLGAREHGGEGDARRGRGIVAASLEHLTQRAKDERPTGVGPLIVSVVHF